LAGSADIPAHTPASATCSPAPGRAGPARCAAARAGARARGRARAADRPRPQTCARWPRSLRRTRPASAPPPTTNPPGGPACLARAGRGARRGAFGEHVAQQRELRGAESAQRPGAARVTAGVAGRRRAGWRQEVGLGRGRGSRDVAAVDDCEAVEGVRVCLRGARARTVRLRRVPRAQLAPPHPPRCAAGQPRRRKCCAKALWTRAWWSTEGVYSRDMGRENSREGGRLVPLHVR